MQFMKGGVAIFGRRDHMCRSTRTRGATWARGYKPWVPKLRVGPKKKGVEGRGGGKVVVFLTSPWKSRERSDV